MEMYLEFELSGVTVAIPTGGHGIRTAREHAICCIVFMLVNLKG